METIYTIDYFIAKFQAIPSNQIGDSQDKGCAYGQCRNGEHNGSRTAEGKALTRLMKMLLPLTPVLDAPFDPDQGTPARINNGETKEYQQPTPKERLLAALYDIKAMQQPKVEEPKVVYKTVVIDSAVKELQTAELKEN